MDGLGESFLRRSRGGARSATGQDRLGEIVYWARSRSGDFRWRDRRLQMARSAGRDKNVPFPQLLHLVTALHSGLERRSDERPNLPRLASGLPSYSHAGASTISRDRSRLVRRSRRGTRTAAVGAARRWKAGVEFGAGPRSESGSGSGAGVRAGFGSILERVAHNLDLEMLV
ncbi:hypothetical protein SO802_025303 [Lithocarpus litseifolius]|uniref:Uncharacterized protein n=1 Tax=Lithocarpus litseifolius TaxID=425828 RepID=A0AAW2BYI0_9ROSI